MNGSSLKVPGEKLKKKILSNRTKSLASQSSLLLVSCGLIKLWRFSVKTRKKGEKKKEVERKTQNTVRQRPGSKTSRQLEGRPLSSPDPIISSLVRTRLELQHVQASCAEAVDVAAPSVRLSVRYTTLVESLCLLCVCVCVCGFVFGGEILLILRLSSRLKDRTSGQVVRVVLFSRPD